MSDRAHVAAWKATVSGLLGGAREVLTPEESQKRLSGGSLPSRYVLVRVLHRYGAPRSADGRTAMRGWRVVFTIVGSEAERSWVRERMDALQDARIEAIDTGLVSHDSDDETDDGSLLSMWTYAT